MVKNDLSHVAAKGILKALGEEIRERRLARGLSQELLAEKSGLHRNFVGLIERGQRNSTVLTLESLAVELKTKVSELIMGAERRVK